MAGNKQKKIKDQIRPGSVRCTHCGAWFDRAESKCPYCGNIYVPGAESEYMDKLGDIRESMEGLAPKPRYARMTEVILTIMSVVVALVAAGLFIGFYRDYKDRESGPYSLSTFRYQTEDGEYARLSRNARENAVHGPRDGYEEYYALGDYFYAASVYEIYEHIPDASGTSYWKSRMEDDAARTGSLSDHLPAVDRMLDTD